MTPAPCRVAGDAVRNAVRGSAPGWPLVLYFHHVHPWLDHYTSLTPDAFERGLELALGVVGPALDPWQVGNGSAWVPPGPTVLVTFDDGYRDNLDHALPVLERLGVRAVFFVVTSRIGQAGGEGPRGDPDPWGEYLDAGDLLELERAGHLVAAHSRTHRPLPDLGTAERRAEVRGSLSDVHAWTGRAPHLFAHPYGRSPHASDLPQGVLGFGTVKAPARPWDSRPFDVRRTYLPAGDEDTWPGLCEGWKEQWWAASP